MLPQNHILLIDPQQQDENCQKLQQGKSQQDIRKNLFHHDSGQALGQVAQRSFEIPASKLMRHSPEQVALTVKLALLLRRALDPVTSGGALPVNYAVRGLSALPSVLTKLS